MKDHHHYHYLFAKQRPALGPVLIGFQNCNERLGFRAVMGSWRAGGNPRIKGWHASGNQLSASATDLC